MPMGFIMPRACICFGLTILLLTGCQQGKPSPDAGTGSTALDERWGNIPVRWTPLFVSNRPVDRNVFLETVITEGQAGSFLAADRLATAALLASPAFGIGLIPHQAIAWHDRDPEIPRRVIVQAVTAARRGYLEHFLSQIEAGKDHESILSGSFDAQSIHLGLVACGLKPGTPAQFFNDQRVEDFKPPTGDPVAVLVEYLWNGRWHHHPAQEWVIDAKTKKPLAMDWLFAGSFMGTYEDDDGKEKKFYAANTGRVICVSNFPAALLDLPFKSAQGSPEDGLDFIPNTDRLPEMGHRVRVVLEPKKGKAP